MSFMSEPTTAFDWFCAASDKVALIVNAPSSMPLKSIGGNTTSCDPPTTANDEVVTVVLPSVTETVSESPLVAPVGRPRSVIAV